MAKATVVKSSRGNDLVKLVMGPKEVAVVVAALAGFETPYGEGVGEALAEAQVGMRNRKEAFVVEERPTIEVE